MKDQKRKKVVKKGNTKQPVYLGEPPKEALDKILGKIAKIAPDLKNKFSKDELIQIIREAKVDCWCFCDCDCVCWCAPACDCNYCLCACEDKIDVTKPILLKQVASLKEKINAIEENMKKIDNQFGDIKKILSELKKSK